MDQHGTGDRQDAQAPRSVDDLRSPWSVRRTPDGRWTIAEHVLHTGGRRWTAGLTPTGGGMTALVLWSGDEVAGHARGSEAQMCALAHRWVRDLLAGRAPTGDVDPHLHGELGA
ncbi:hypothetical protein AB0425_38265 [Actinosynnema sp. NPDC051121]